MTAPETAKAFLNTQQTADRLQISRSQLQNMFGLIPHLYVRKSETRLFPTAYVLAFAEYLSGQKAKATLAAARAFRGTDVARTTSREAYERLNRSINSKVTYSTNELMALLGIARMTITKWSQNGTIETFYQEASAVRRRPGVKPGKILLIPTRPLRQAMEWRALAK